MKKNIVILGGGTAGWMAANLMAACWIEQGFSITLIESPEIGIIGVGEGSTPQLKSFFDYLNIAESEWMPACNATYKNGIRFNGWSSLGQCESYFHPFESMLDVHTQPAFFEACDYRRNGHAAETQPEKYFLSASLAYKKLSPIPSKNFPFKIGYGYHFDSGLLGNFLRDKAIEKGVRHIQRKVLQVNQNTHGDIESLLLESGDSVVGDLFVDCSGFAGVLIQKTLGVPFKPFSNNLFNDSAVALPTEKSLPLQSQTLSTALNCGWAWKIPLGSRNGNGYVYSSAYCSSDQAEFELRQHLGLLKANIEARHLKMNVGQVEKHWEKNCVAIGLSQGFIEPLEATALHIVQETIQGFIDAWELGGFTNVNQGKFNQRITDRFEGVRDYIVAHYICNSRQDTDYWFANRTHANISDNLKGVIETWVGGGDLHHYLTSRSMDKYYQPMSWYALLSGYGIYPKQKLFDSQADKKIKAKLTDVQYFIQHCALNFTHQ